MKSKIELTPDQRNTLLSILMDRLILKDENGNYTSVELNQETIIHEVITKLTRCDEDKFYCVVSGKWSPDCECESQCHDCVFIQGHD